METKDSRLTFSKQDQIDVVGFCNMDILDEGLIQLIGEDLGQLIEQDPNPRLLIDFDVVKHLSSAALGMLITINNQIRQKSGQLRLANIDPQIYEVFVITKLDTLFQIHSGVDGAIKSFK